MILKIEHGYVHLRGTKGGGIYEIGDFDNDELREARAVLHSKIIDIPMTTSQRETMEDSVKKINEELEKRINEAVERRR